MATPASSGDGQSSGSSNSSDSGSTTDNDSIASQEKLVGRKVKFDWLLTDAVIDAVNKDEEIPERKPGPPVAAAKPAPPRDLGNGVFHYVVFVPSWTDPDWEDDPTFAATPLPPDATEEQRMLWAELDAREVNIRKGDSTQRMRPALLERDLHKNPTPYAVRFGIYPRAAPGRSRLSPTSSNTRRIGLRVPQQTATGFKDYITVEDARIEERNFDQIAANLGQRNMTFKEYLTRLSIEGGENMSDMHRAFIDLRHAIDEDEDFQRFMMAGMSTDELIYNKAHSVDDDFGVFTDLSGPLHDLVRRSRWESSVMKGTAEDDPRFMYNILGRSGDFAATDNSVWAAIQPALQLVTRILNANHPCWMAMLNAYCRRPGDPTREYVDSKKRNKLGSLTAIWPDPDHPRLSKEAKRLQELGIDLRKMTAEFLSDRLRLMIGSIRRNNNAEDSGYGQVTWGVTWPTHPKEANLTGINISIAGELIWPLLVPSFTNAEKANASFLLAASLLHELGLGGLNSEAIACLDLLGWKVCRTGKYEPFWMDEPKAEAGFALENQLFGGLVESALVNPVNAFARYTANPLVIVRCLWPIPIHNPHIHEYTAEELLDPHLPVDDYKTLVGVDEHKKFFTSEFWNSSYAKYSHHCFKLDPTKPTYTNRRFIRKKELMRKYGRSAGTWMYDALENLVACGESIFGKYLYEVTTEALGQVQIRKRWHHNCQSWHHRDKEFYKVNEKIAEREKILDDLISDALSPIDAKAARVTAQNAAYNALLAAGETLNVSGTIDLNIYIQQLQAKIDKHFVVIADLYREAHRIALVTVTESQHMAIEYMRLPFDDRKILYQRYGDYLHSRLYYTIEPALRMCRINVEKIAKGLLECHLNQAGADFVASVTNELVTKLGMACNLSKDAMQYFTVEYCSRAADLNGKFQGVPGGSYRPASGSLHRLFMEEFKHVTGPIRDVVLKYLELLGRQRNLQEDENMALERVATERLRTGLFALGNNHRTPREMFGGARVEPSSAEETGMDLVTNENFLQPPEPSSSSLNEYMDGVELTGAAPAAATIGFGVPGLIKPTPVPDYPGHFAIPDPKTGFAQYASANSPFSSFQGLPWLGPGEAKSFGKAEPLTGSHIANGPGMARASYGTYLAGISI
ncbi:hypothetical protein GQ53DRAFT_812049 [Thozetella sp. PMI_491]|nr:hypothetical protein GQ53DRAFT_812049 [Thozetella sp. PMI_491]